MKSLNIQWGLLAPAFVAAWGVALLPLHILPFVVGSLIDGLGKSPTEIGFLMTLELGSVGLVSLLLSPMMGRLPRRTVALAGLAVTAAATAVSIFVTSYETMLIVRVISGIGCGALSAAGNATVSSSRDPDRLYAQMTFLTVVLMVVLFGVISQFGAGFSHKLIYTLMLAVIIIQGAAVFIMPQRSEAPAPVSETTELDNVASGLAFPKLPLFAAIVSVVVVYVYYTRDTLVWAFSERVGLDVGLSGETIAFVFALHTVIGLIGPAIASVVGTKFGRLAPIGLGVLVTGAVTYTISQTKSQEVYIFAVLIWTSVHLFTLAYLMGMAAVLDSQGRVIAAAGGAILLGNATAPAVAGYLLDTRGPVGLGQFTIVAVAVTFVMAVALAIYINKKEAAAAGGGAS